MRKALLGIVALVLGLLPGAAQMQLQKAPQRAGKATISTASPLSLSSLPGQQRYGAQQEQWWQRTTPSSRDAVVGNYIQDSYNNAQTTTTVTGMYQMSISAGTAADQVVIRNMFGVGGSLQATINAADGTLTIPSGQLVGTMEDGSQMYLYLADFNENHYFNNPMVARISPRGIIYMPQALVVVTGTTNGQIRCYSDQLYKMNATQTDYSLWLEGEQKVQTYPVHVSRINNAQILVKNFYGMGYPVTGNIDTVGNIGFPYTQVGVGTNSSGTRIVVRNYNVTNINYNNNPPTPTCNSSATPAQFVADSIVTGPYCVAGSTSSNRVDLVLKSVIKVQPADAFKPLNTAFTLPGSGTKEDPYRVATAQDLLTLSRATNYNVGLQKTVSGTKCIFPDAYFVQTADIDMSDVENFEPVCAIDQWGWGGNYDGQGHTISNLTVKQSRGNSYRAGLFGEISLFGSVRNLKLVNPDVSSANGFVGTVCGRSYGTIENVQAENAKVLMDNISSSYCGGITGYVINNGKVEDCTVSGSVKGNNFVGGIAGNNNGAKVRRCIVTATIERTPGNEDSPSIGGIQGTFTRDTAMIEDCVFAGNIILIGNEEVGGILGESTGKGEVNRCWFAGQIMHRGSSSSTADIGGIVGTAKDVKINDCLSTGIVQSYMTPNAGGIAGVMSGQAAVKGSLMTGTVMVSGDVRGNEIAAAVAEGCTISDSYFDKQTVFNGGTEHGMLTTDLISGQLPAGFNAEAWDLAAGKYPMLKRFIGHERAALDRVPMMLANNENIRGIRSAFTLGSANGVTWHFFHNGRYADEGNGLKINGNNVTVTATTLTSDTIVALSGNYFRMIPVKVTPREFDGDGTQASPYIIRNKADLDRVFKAVDVDLFDYEGTYFRLEGDIDFAGVTNFGGYSHNAPAYAFNGVLDGNGHHIKNLKLAVPQNSSAIGCLFMFTGKKSVIKNLIIDSSCEFNGGSNVAVITASYGLVENIVNLANVTAQDNFAAGIVSQLYADSKVLNCFNAGTIRGGHRNVGGIVAAAQRGSFIEGCQNSGNVIAAQGPYNEDPTDVIYVGGIVGDSEGTVKDCLNQGMIMSYAHSGGIAGSYTGGEESHMTGCVNTGVVVEGTSNSTRGAVIGSGYSVTTGDRVKNCFFDSQMAYHSAADNTTLVGTKGMTTSALVSGNAIEGLDAALWQFEKGKYPVLKAFAAQPASQWYAATHVDFVETPRLESRFDKRHDAAITAPQGTKITLDKGTDFSVVDGKTLRHTESKEVAVDTLRLASADGSYSMNVPLFATPRLLANGEGTEANPWIINNANDWNTLAFYSNQYQKGFDSEYFRIGADLDFSNGFETICLGSNAYFNGIIDGNGKTIRNLKTEYDADTQKYIGLIGSGGANAKVFNLTIDSTCNFIGNQYVGAVAGHFEGEIYNVTNRATVSTTKMQYAGGIVGETDENGYVHNCVNYGAITSQNNNGAGGIVGQQFNPNCRVEDCVNYGVITAKGSCGGIVGTGKGSVARCENHADITSSSTNPGGILGYFWCITDTTTISDCKNYGKIKGTGNAAGGITGYMQGSGNFRNCYNEGEVTSGASYAGGILGYSSTNNATWTIRNVENRANVTANAYAGGILGSSNGTSKDTPATLDSAENYGNVKTLKTNYAGGIVGSVGSYVVVRNAYNYGDEVSSFTTQAGGIAGRSTGVVENCYNHANVTAKSYSVGGIIGESNTSTLTDYGCAIRNCINVGNVESTGTTDATSFKVGGLLGYGWVKVENSVNRGDVKGRKSVGGIVGLPCKGRSATQLGTQVLNSYTSGRVECTVDNNAKTCGAVMGDNTTAVTFTKIENSYYDSQMAGMSLKETYADASNEAVKGLPTTQLFKAPLGAAFTTYENGYPMPSVLATKDFVLMASAAVILNTGDNADRVKDSFKVTVPAGATWSAPNMTFSQHGTAIWTAADLVNRTPVTVTVGNHRHNIMIQLTTTTGVNGVDGDNGDIREVQYYNLQGIRLSAPMPGVNVRVTIYNNGTRRTERIMIGQR